MLDGGERHMQCKLLERGGLWSDASRRGNCSVNMDQEMSEYGILE